jgi:cold shock CspA family protein
MVKYRIILNLNIIKNKALQEGAEVTFEITQGDKGPQASNIETL